MICPHCGTGTAPRFTDGTFGLAHGLHFNVRLGNCSECEELIVLAYWGGGPDAQSKPFLIFPVGPRPRPIPPEVTGEYAQDFREASLVLDASPKASAAVSRRLHQHILREKAGVTRCDLDQEITAAIDQGHLPSDLAYDLDMIRTTGNFAAHPIKSTNTGEVVEVKPGEAEALLDLVEELLDYYFVRPAHRAAKRQALNAKLEEAGKPPLKEPPAAPPTAPRVA